MCPFPLGRASRQLTEQAVPQATLTLKMGICPNWRFSGQLSPVLTLGKEQVDLQVNVRLGDSEVLRHKTCFNRSMGSEKLPRASVPPCLCVGEHWHCDCLDVIKDSCEITLSQI